MAKKKKKNPFLKHDPEKICIYTYKYKNREKHVAQIRHPAIIYITYPTGLQESCI